MRRCEGAVQRAARALRVLAAGLPLLAGAQNAPPSGTTESTPPAVRFRALEVHERREAIADILSQLTLERDGRREEHRAYVEAAATAQALPSERDDDAKLRGAMALAATLERLESQLRESRLRRLGILDRVQAEAGRADPGSAENMRMLREADREVRLMLTQQEDQARRVVHLKQRLGAFVQAVPPPAEFEGKAGVRMRLVGKGQQAFYVSSTPIPVSLYRHALEPLSSGSAVDAWTAYAASTEPDAALTGASWYEAQRFCQWLSAQEGVRYLLPSAAEAALISTPEGQDPLAFWTADIWTPEDHTLRRDLRRFAVAMVTAWDPGARLSTKPGGFAEVPFARHSELAVYVVTARQTGLTHRWQRLKAPPP